MKKRFLALALALLLVVGTALAAGGSSGDPLISLSYLTDSFLPSLLGQAEQRIQSGNAATYAQAQSDLASAAGQLGQSSGTSYQEQLSEQRYKAGDTISCPTGSSFVLMAGSAQLSQGLAVDVSSGGQLSACVSIPANHRCITPEDTAAVYTITSDTAVAAAQGYFTFSPSSGFDCNALADALHTMGIFRGTNVTIGSGYDLEAVPSRIQGLIMFLRLLGEEDAALACTASHPFRDVPDWCSPYVAYAFEKGYTNGVDLPSGRFGTNDTLSAAQYLTFVLRALGYEDSGAVPDFAWDTAPGYCQSIGLLTPGEVQKLTSDSFLRAHVVYLSYYALSFPIKGRSTLLLDKLIAGGSLDAATAVLAMNAVTSPRIS